MIKKMIFQVKFISGDPFFAVAFVQA